MKPRTYPLVGRYDFGWGLYWLLAILIVNTLYLGLVDAIRGFAQPWMIPFGIIAFITGWVFSGTNRKDPAPILTGLLIGLLIQFMIHSGALSDLLRALLEALAFVPIIPNHLPLNIIPARIIFSLYLMMADISAFFIDGFNWTAHILGRQNGFDPGVPQAFWGSLFWAIVFSAGWMLRRRRHAFLAVLPASLLLLSVHGYTRQETNALVFYSGVVLFLIVLQEHLKRETRWDEEKIDFSEELRFDLASMTIPIISLIVIITLIIPNISFQDLRDFYEGLVKQDTLEQRDLSESFGLERTPLEAHEDTTQSGMPRSHLVGNLPELSGIVIMEIDTGEVFIPPQANISPPLPKYYWFGRSYDIYNGSGWTTSPILTETIPAGEPIESYDAAYWQPIIQTVTKTDAASQTMYFTGQPASANQTLRAARRETTGEYFSATLEADNYEAESWVLALSEPELRAANEPPPTAITDNYLQIPDTVPERVLDLAANLTFGTETPFEKAQAVESYLRQFTYSLELPEPPVDRDIVDYFLFDLQKGYCDYYASAMLILARAAGLPARLAVGYATGSYDYTKSLFVVTEANAHAWPEIYIAPFGWIPFEPTAGLPTFDWTTEAVSPFPIPEMPNGEDFGLEEPSTWLNILGLGLLVLSVLLVGALWYWLVHRKKSSLSTSRQIIKIYQKMRAFFEGWMPPHADAMTPKEYQMTLITLVQKSSASSRFKKFPSSISHEIQTLTEAYQQGVYAPRPLSPVQVKKARQSWHSLLWRTVIFRVLFQINK